MNRTRTLIALAAVVFGNSGCDNKETTGKITPTGADPGVTQQRLLAAAEEPANWLSHGRTYNEQRFSSLDTINATNVAELGLAWYFDVPTQRGMEATPIVVDGTMYVTGAWSIVYALDAATGEELWRYDPRVAKDWGKYACCDVVNRGVAVWEHSVFVGTLDGYLVSLDARTGAENWRKDTIDRQPPYTITGAPRVVNGLVIIGNGGAEYGVRGYVSAYDAATGDMRWRFYTVPGNPDEGFENDAMATAAETWTGEWWKLGGGGTVWDSMAYDPDLNLLYVGTGNGSPWNRKVRSPDGGDNLFVSTILALRPDSGEYVWHYQVTPGDTWDYTATQHIILADIEMDGALRKVLLQAPKNGYFYVLDRTDGRLIAADAYVKVNWSTGVDLNTGRPIEVPNARYDAGAFFNMPSPLGGHNWQPMAFNPTTRLVYVPTQDIPFLYADDPDFTFEKAEWNTGIDMVAGAPPEDPEAFKEVMSLVTGQLIAWDPVERKEKWRYQHAGPWNGGVLATAGNLVFQGSLIGEMAAYDANNGERLWQFDAQTGVAAAPISYAVNNEQHIAVAVGWGTIFGLIGGEGTASLGMQNRSRILAFKLNGDQTLPIPPPQPAVTIVEPPAVEASPLQLARGKNLYTKRCSTCHGDSAVSGGVIVDLRYSTPETHDMWDAIVLGGAYRTNGMPAFATVLTADDSKAIQTYVLARTRLAWERQQRQ